MLKAVQQNTRVCDLSFVVTLIFFFFDQALYYSPFYNYFLLSMEIQVQNMKIMSLSLWHKVRSAKDFSQVPSEKTRLGKKLEKKSLVLKSEPKGSLFLFSVFQVRKKKEYKVVVLNQSNLCVRPNKSFDPFLNSPTTMNPLQPRRGDV